MERIGVYICHCGTNIAGTVDVEEVTDFASTLDQVAVARHYAYMCSDPGQDLIKEDIQEEGLSRVVVASCSPLMHEHTFRRACDEAAEGLPGGAGAVDRWAHGATLQDLSHLGLFGVNTDTQDGVRWTA